MHVHGAAGRETSGMKGLGLVQFGCCHVQVTSHGHAHLQRSRLCALWQQSCRVAELPGRAAGHGAAFVHITQLRCCLVHDVHVGGFAYFCVLDDTYRLQFLCC